MFKIVMAGMLTLAGCSSNSSDSCSEYAAFTQSFNAKFAPCTQLGGNTMPFSSCDESACATSLNSSACTDQDRSVYPQETTCEQQALAAYDAGCSAPALAVLQAQFLACSTPPDAGLSGSCILAFQKNTAVACDGGLD
jgi:hypothetical protein